MQNESENNTGSGGKRTTSLCWDPHEYCFKHGWLPHLAKTNQIRLLVSFVIVAYILALEQGQLQERKNPVLRPATGKTYRPVSVFRDGLQKIKENLTCLIDFREYLHKRFPKKSTVIKIV